MIGKVSGGNFHLGINPETKEQAKQWIETSSTALKKAKPVSRADEVMTSVYWFWSGISLINYLAMIL